MTNDELLYQVHVLLNPYVEPDGELTLTMLASKLGVEGEPKKIVAEVSERLVQVGNDFAVQYLSAELKRLNGDMDGYRQEAAALVQEAMGTLAGACAAVSLAHHVLERISIFLNENKPPEGLHQVLEIIYDPPVPQPEYSNYREREAYALMLAGEDCETPFDSIHRAALRSTARWVERAMACESYPQAERFRVAINETTELRP